MNQADQANRSFAAQLAPWSDVRSSPRLDDTAQFLHNEDASGSGQNQGHEDTEARRRLFKQEPDDSGAKQLHEDERRQWKESQALRSRRLLVRDNIHGVCGACQRIKGLSPFSHQDYEDLAKSAQDGCAPCGVIFTGLQPYHTSQGGPSVEVVVDRPNEQLWIREEGTSRSVCFDIYVLRFDDDKRLPTSVSEESIQAETDLYTHSDTLDFEDAFLFPTLHRMIPNGMDSLRTYQQIQHWLNNCRRNHPRCSMNGNFLHDATYPYPTRLLEIHRDKIKLVEHLVVSPLAPRSPYAILSYCWGDGHTMTTTSANLAYHLDGSPWMALPQTIQDAVLVCSRLGIKFIWVDALCVLQDSPEDWNSECKRMGDYYRWAVVTLSALDASGVHEGFLSSRTPLSTARLFRSVWDPQGYGGHPEERVLSTRIVHFAKSELLWECLTCSAREGLTELNDHRLDCSNIQYSGASDFKRALFIPNPSDHYNIADGAFAIWQRFVVEYSTRKLTRPEDRLHAIAGLALILAEKTGSPYCTGIFGNDLIELAWQKDLTEDEQTNPPALAPAPSWSWARPNSRVKFPFYNQDRLVSTLDARFEGYDGSISHGCLVVSAYFREMMMRPRNVEIRIAERAHMTKTHTIPQIRKEGCKCETEVEETLVYSLEITPHHANPDCWARVDVHIYPYVEGCRAYTQKYEFRDSPLSVFKLV
ncbi:uncharacterized protein PAC_16349 [Phialocephala subalpina]|uniref:Heterokaryon incompatibility domain-containing protein n=1 Tax=Phialocephala subalpina TaxID=576137 RepID=A0A1L7XN50_9HELO|nr:uncharacterized protein PAC_16349 [Phialocephala subalpina]